MKSPKNRSRAIEPRVSVPAWIGLILTFSLAFAMTMPVAAQTPPKNLNFVNDHWTAWNPPAAIEEGAEVHIIQRGDTLWDLAQRFYGDPYLWPQIWERNQYILDAHWIYPGDPLVLGMDVESAESVLGQPGENGGMDGDDPNRLVGGPGLFGTGRSSFVQLGTPDDIYCSGYIGDPDEAFSFTVTGSEYEVLGPTVKISERGNLTAAWGAVDAIKVGLDTGDIVYVDGGRSAGLAPGDTFTAIIPGATIRHPHSDRVVGTMYQYAGRLRILSTQEDTAIAEVSSSCTSFPIGTVLKPFVEEPIPSERKTPLRPVNYPESSDAVASAPVVLYAKDGIVTAGLDHVVFIELGESDDVIPGDQFTVYRENRNGNPPVVLGELAVMSVHSNSSVAKITESRYPIYAGDRLLVK